MLRAASRLLVIAFTDLFCRMNLLVSFFLYLIALRTCSQTPVDEPDDDNMEEIDAENIISDGRRTRGRKIDFAKAAEENPEEDEESEDDGDFEAPDDEMEE